MRSTMTLAEARKRVRKKWGESAYVGIRRDWWEWRTVRAWSAEASGVSKQHRLQLKCRGTWAQTLAALVAAVEASKG